MRTILSAALIVLTTATAGSAQDRVILPERSEASRVERVAPERTVLDRKFWAVAAALNAAMLLDTKSTFDVSRACPQCEEANPVVAPFFRRGAAVTFTAGEFFDAGVMTLAAKMKGSDRRWVRRTWWVVPAALVAGHTLAQRHNVNLIR